MAFLLDTNIVSASRRPERQGPEFQAFLHAFDIENAYLSAVTVMEIEFGIARERGRNPAFADDLAFWLAGKVLPAFESRILTFDVQTAALAGRLPTPDRRPSADAMIAATALAHNLVLVTRNVVDFQPFGVPCLNPWTPLPAG
jgi:predicted nucleic acid-binding protein